MNIFVANLSPSTTSKDLQKLFAHYGFVYTVKVIMDRFTGKSKGFGFVEMPNNYEASEALKELDHTIFQDYTIDVKYSQPKSYRISANEAVNRNSSISSSGRDTMRQYKQNSTSIIKTQRDNITLRNYGYRGSGYKGFDRY